HRSDVADLDDSIVVRPSPEPFRYGTLATPVLQPLDGPNFAWAEMHSLRVFISRSGADLGECWQGEPERPLPVTTGSATLPKEKTLFLNFRESTARKSIQIPQRRLPPTPRCLGDLMPQCHVTRA